MDQRVRLEDLSKREGQVLEKLQSGWTRSEIAAALGVGVRSVDSYTLRLQRKFGVTGSRALAHAAQAMRGARKH